MTPDFAALIRQIEDQEERLQFTSFSHADAWRLGSLVMTMATDRGHGVTIDITRGDQQVFHAATAGSTADNDEWIARKIRVVRRFEASSFLVGRRCAATGVDFIEATGLPQALYAAHGGCFPIKMRGAGLMGTLTVSGLPQEDDHALVVEAIESFLLR